jgi:hypothetical protein
MDSSDPEKRMNDVELVHDKDILSGSEGAKEDAMHFGELSQDELILEKKLRRKIDSVIMPMVVLVMQWQAAQTRRLC